MCIHGVELLQFGGLVHAVIQRQELWDSILLEFVDERLVQ